MKIERFNENVEKSEKEILDNIKGLCVSLSDNENMDIELEFFRTLLVDDFSNDLNAEDGILSAEIDVIINDLFSLKSSFDDFKQLSKFIGNIDNISNIFKEIKQVLNQIESEMDCKWSIRSHELFNEQKESINKITININTGIHFDKHDLSITGWEIF